MKKQSLLLITGGLLALASCNTNTAGNDDAQAKIDSMVNERVEQIRMELEMKNDSIINELAMYRADSIIAASKGRTVARPRPKAEPKVESVPSASGSSMSEGSMKGGATKGGVNDRPGASNSGGGVNDRPGASNSGGGVNDRQGASNK